MLRMLIRQDVAEKIGRLYKSGMVPTAAQREEFRASRDARPRLSARLEGSRDGGANTPENYAVIGNVAHISVEGVLSEEPDFWAWLFGEDGTTYADIRQAFALAGADPAVHSVLMRVSSPGGYVDGIFETLAAVETFAKPILVNAAHASSGAYALAAMAGKIHATSIAAEFGSIGVASSFYLDPSKLDITSTEAPNKRPDLTTEEGRAVIRAELDAVHELFVDAIARGRKNATGESFTVAKVNAEFGRGSVLLADEAFARGMVDKLAKKPKRGSAVLEGDDEEPPAAPPKLTVVSDDGKTENSPRETGPARKTIIMTKEELKAQHPALYAEVFDAGKLVGVSEGTTEERKRVCAHLKMAESTGAKKVAIDAINSGASLFDQTVQADYLSAAVNRSNVAARQADSDEAEAALGGAKPAAAEGGKDLGDNVADLMEARAGKAKAS